MAILPRNLVRRRYISSLSFTYKKNFGSLCWGIGFVKEHQLVTHFLVFISSTAMAIPDDLLNTPVFIENVKTRRYLFPCGDPIAGDRGAEGGWLSSSGFESPKMVGADANYYNRARFVIRKQDDKYLLENEETKRYCFSSGDPIQGDRGDEKGWKASSGFEAPCCVGADANYYNGALWIATCEGDEYMFENERTKRYLFADGSPIEEPRGKEGGWLASSGFASPDIKGTDANYYNHGKWKIVKC